MKRPSLPTQAVYVATFLAAAAFIGGFALAGALTVNQGSPEAAGGNYESTTAISWWSQAGVGLTTVPSTLPSSLTATTAAAPQTLPASATSYLINAGTSGDLAHYFAMTEAAGAPTGTEVELTFSVSTGTTPTLTQVTVYVESPSTSPTTATQFTFEYDLGSAATASIVLNSVQQVSQVCPAVGTCP